MSRVQFVIVVLAVAGLGLVWGVNRMPPEVGFLPGDCPYYAATTESLFADGDLDLTNQLTPGKSGADIAETLRPHSGFFALGSDGRAVPKHSILMPIVALPFYAAFGFYGFLVFNIIQIVLLMWAVAVLAGDTPVARLLVTVGYLTSPFFFYTYNFSPDVFGTLLVIGAYIAASRQRWVWCGLLAGLAVWAKVYLAVIVLPVAVFVICGGWRAVLTSACAAAIGVVLMGAVNTYLYGGPLVTGYDCDARVQPNGTITTFDHYGIFNQPFLTGLSRLLFDERLGLVWTAPLWVSWPVGVWFLWRSGRGLLAATLTASVTLNLAFFACYDQWDTTLFGNRFLFPALALGLAAQGAIRHAVVIPTPGHNAGGTLRPVSVQPNPDLDSIDQDQGEAFSKNSRGRYPSGRLPPG